MGPKYSPEGKTLVFESSHRGGVSSIYRVNEDGTGLYRLTAGADDRTPVFSPEGNTIAFSRTLDGKTHIWTMTAAGGSPRQLTKDDSVHTDPTWSSDGRSLLYVSDTGPGRDIYVGYLNSTRTAISTIGRLTSVGTNVAPDYLGCGGTSTPAQKVVFSSNRTGNYELHQMDPNGNNIQRISDHAGVDGTPTWAPQGGATNLVLAYVSDRAGEGTRKIFVRRSSRFGYNDTNVSGSGSASDFTPDFWGPDVCPLQASSR
jgi:TolB protein